MDDQELTDLSQVSQDKRRLLSLGDNANKTLEDRLLDESPYAAQVSGKSLVQQHDYDYGEAENQGCGSPADIDEELDHEFATDVGDYQNPYQHSNYPGKSKRKRNARPGRPLGFKNSVRFIAMLMMPLAILAALFVVVNKASGSSQDARLSSPNAAPTGLSYPSGFDMRVNWGAISPYFEEGMPFEGITRSQKNEMYNLPPRCELQQVHVLHRHAERYPTKGRASRMKTTAEKIQQMNISPEAKGLQWMTNWTYELGSELLTAPGVATELKSGSDFWASHGRFLFSYPEGEAKDEDGSAYNLFYSPKMVPKYVGSSERQGKLVIRATDQSRIQTSARAWAAGFFGLYGGQEYVSNTADDVYDLVLQSETAGSNSTLASYLSCPNALSQKILKNKAKVNQWIASYLANASKRLQKVLPGMMNVTAQDAFAMQDLCTFETAAYGSSPFCSLFTETEWRGYEYAADLDFYYDSSFGSKFGAAEGTGWLYELRSRLEQKPIVEAGFGVNITQDESNFTFPLDQPVYLDMTHDSVIMSVLTALDFTFLKKVLPAESMPVPRQFIVSRLTPFGSRLFVEVFDCGEDKQIRLKLNNRILPLGHLSGCPSTTDGLCPFDGFVASLTKRLQAIDFDSVCYGGEEEKD